MYDILSAETPGKPVSTTLPNHKTVLLETGTKEYQENQKDHYGGWNDQQQTGKRK